MSFIREFSYPDVIQRRIIYSNIFFTLIIIGFIFTDSSFDLKFYYFYFPVSKMIAITAATGLFLGSFFGKMIFNKVSNCRLIYLITDISFGILTILYLLRKYIFFYNFEPFLNIFLYSIYIFPLFIFIITFISGIKFNYFLKLSCGDFIDEKQGIFYNIILSLVGVSIGVLIAPIKFIYSDINIILLTVPIILFVTCFFVKLRYNPDPLFAQEFENDTQSNNARSKKKDNLLFTYLNIIYMILFIFLGFQTIIRFYGDLFLVEILFFIIISFSIIAGFFIGKSTKFSYFHIYSESIFPVFFLAFIFSMFIFGDKIPYYVGILLFIPISIIFGITSYHTLNNIFINYNHKKRFIILEFAIFILPFPIILSLSFINFTNSWFFIFTYILSILCILIPGFHLINLETKRGYLKAMYFTYFLISIPILILINMKINIPFNKNFYVLKVENYEKLRNINYNSLYINERVSVKINKRTIFNTSDSIIRNLKRSLLPIGLYLTEKDKKKILFIDSNQKFFRNPVIGYFKNSLCLDVIPKSIIDYSTLPFSGSQKYIPEENHALLFFYKNNKKFDLISNIPNILDQNYNYFRFSKEYYKLIQSRLTDKGIHLQIINVSGCSSDFFTSMINNLSSTFKSNTVFIFSNIIAIFSSNDENSLKIDSENISNLRNLFEQQKAIKGLFLDEYHVLSHVAYTKLDEFKNSLNISELNPLYLFLKTKKYELSKDITDRYISINDKFLELFDKKPEKYYEIQNYKNQIFYKDKILKLLKSADMSESLQNYSDETKILFELKKLTEYRPELRKYILHILSYKENYFFNAAVNFEKQKKWDKAKELYNAILTINKDNFETNYRMGLLCITIQDIDNSFKYLQNAMKLKKDHPKVLYQMGVLLFSTGKIDEAIEYFNRALQKRETSSSIFLYLGICYEKKNNIPQAEYYYTKALLEDPNDINIKSRLENIKKIKEEEKNKWKLPAKKNELEDEKDVEMPLPINKSAYDIRLGDKEEVEKDKKNGNKQ